MKQSTPKLYALLTAAALLLGGCAGTQTGAGLGVPDGDVLTQTVLSSEKIPVTVLVKYAFTINAFEQAAEAAFPNLDLIQVGNYTSNMGTAEYAARLQHDDLTDLVMTWPLEVGEEDWSSRLLDLSSLPLAGKYSTAMLERIARDGKLYYLPGPSQVRAIVYNKTLFTERGWAVPTDFDSFVALCQTIEASGMRSLQLGLGNAEVLDTAFVGYGYESSFSTPDNASHLAAFNAGRGSFADNFMPALESFQALIDAGVLQKGDLSLTYSDREHMLFGRQCAMTEDSVLMARMGFAFNGCTDEFGLMPFFNPNTNSSDWARLYPVCYIGLNAHLAEAKNKTKYDLVLHLMDYISTPEGQSALAGDTGAMYSTLTSAPLPDIPEIADLVPALTRGRCAVFPTLQNAQGALRRGLAGMVAGDLTAQDVVKLVDAENANPPVPTPPRVLGQAAQDFSLTETGYFIADTLRAALPCEMALFLDNGKDGLYNGKGVSGRIYSGDVTELDVQRILPDLKHEEKGELWRVTMTGESLLKTLEYAIPVDNNVTGWFYYVSGLKLSFAPAAVPGARVLAITDASGAQIDPEKIYTLAVADGSVPEELLLSCEKTGLLVSDLVKSAIEAASTISPTPDGRMTICPPAA